MVDTATLNRQATDASAFKEFYALGVETPRTRAPHLLLKMSTGHSDVQLNRFIHHGKAVSGAPGDTGIGSRFR